MFVIPYYEPAVEIYSPTESANLEECNMLEQRLQFLGIKSSSIQRELGVGRNSHIENKLPKSEIMINPFESLKLQQNVKRIEVKKEKGSVRSWLWLQYLSYHGNCSLCDRPLNAHFEEIVMQRCAHALHLECAEEIRQNRHGYCNQCELNKQKLDWLRRNNRFHCCSCYTSHFCTKN